MIEESPTMALHAWQLLGAITMALTSRCHRCHIMHLTAAHGQEVCGLHL